MGSIQIRRIFGQILVHAVAKSSFSLQTVVIKGLWRGLIPHRIVIFTWFALLGKVNTQAKLASLGIILVEESICFLCGNSVESNDHLFIHCLLSYHLWSWWLQLWNAKWVFPLSVRVAIDQWASPIKGQFINEVCSVIFSQ